MKLTIIPSDGAVYENDICYSGLTWAGTPEDVHALQYDTDLIRGWIEYKDGKPNEDIFNLPEWALNAEAAWTEANTPKPPEPPVPPTAEQNAAKAKQLLIDTDWVELPSVSDPVNDPYLSNVAAFEEYRLWLRRVAVSPIAGDLPWPIKPVEDWR